MRFLRRVGFLVTAMAFLVTFVLPLQALAVDNCPCNIWAPTATPANPSINDPNAVELGVKFKASVDGTITGVRFYKGTGNGGTHVGNLWTLGGTKLATVMFSGETGTGWQQANFATPVNVTANTVYVASYFAPQGRYSANSNYFASAATVNGPLTALQNGTNGGNGVYRYGSTSGFPNETWQSSNYWVDVVFQDGTVPPPADTTPST